MDHSGNWNLIYKYEVEKLKVITSKINILKEKSSIKNSDKHIREFREKIEKVFQEME